VSATELERTPEVATASAAYGRGLPDIWKTPPGLAGWLSTVDYKEIGKRYIVTVFAFLLLGGVEALVMRVQLAQPNERLLTPAFGRRWNQSPAVARSLMKQRYRRCYHACHRKAAIPRGRGC
jgi:hypothetical protein